MIRTLIKLVIVLLIGFALYHVGDVYWDHYQFEDSVRELAQFSEHSTPDEVRDKVVELAAANDIPLSADNVSVTRGNRRIEISGVYFRDVEVLPRYVRRWEFELHVVVITLS